MQQLEGRVAVITGGGSGIGEALALACADAGMDVAVSDIEEAKAHAVAEAVRKRGRRVLATRVDVSDPSSFDSLAEQTYGELGACHLLCNNAGVLVMGKVHEKPVQDWEWVFGVNVLGIVNGARAFVPRMIEARDEGHVLNTCSVNALTALPANGAYSASKYAALAITETMRWELESHRIGVSALCPANVMTNILTADRNRPERLGESSIAGDDALMIMRASNKANATPITPARAAEVALDGVRRGAMYIPTHPGTREMVQARFDAILDAYDQVRERHPDLP